MTQRLWPILLAVAIILLTAHAAFAAADPVDVLIKALVKKNIITEEDAAGVRAEIAQTRKEEAASQKSFNVTGKRPIKLSGYLQERFTHSQEKGVNDIFEARRIRLTASGDATPEVDYKIQVDFSGSRRALTEARLVTDPDPQKTRLTTRTAVFSKPTLLDAVLGYKVGRDAKWTVGQFKIPFGQENLASSSDLDTINRTQVTEALVPGRDNGSQGRDVGIQYASSTPLGSDSKSKLDYAVGLFQGAGINVGDENNRKDIAARLVFRPAGGLAVGLAHYNGAAGADKLRHNRTGLEAVVPYGLWVLKSEYIWASDGAVKKKGWHATILRKIGASSQAVLRYDNLDPDTSVGGNGKNTLTLGWNQFLNKDGSARWQLNYERRREQGSDVDNDLFLAQFQAGF